MNTVDKCKKENNNSDESLQDETLNVSIIFTI